MAVLPERQNQGIGSALALAGLDMLRQKGEPAVIVLGHPEFYPRFGFVPASTYGIGSRYDVPDEAFMAIELQPGALIGKSGKVVYSPEFDAL
jgi:putative acetyltransferase